MGAFITKPFLLEHDRIQVNADARRGMVKVEITDEWGKPIEKYDAKRANAVTGNGLNLDLTWKDKVNVKDLKNRVVRLRVYMVRSRLYAFHFVID